MQIGIYDDGSDAPFAIPQSTGDVDALNEIDSTLENALDFYDLGLLREGALLEVFDIYSDKVGLRFDEIVERYGITRGVMDDDGSSIAFATVPESAREAIDALAALPMDRAARRRAAREAR